MPHEAHKRQVEEVMDTLEERPEGTASAAEEEARRWLGCEAAADWRKA